MQKRFGQLITVAGMALASGSAWAASGVFVTTSDYATGSTAYLAPGADVAEVNLLGVHSDAGAYYRDGKVYVVNRLGQDNILVLDVDDLQTPLTQFSVGNGTNPQDIEIVSPNKAYVSRYKSTALLIVDPQSGAELGTIDLSAFADADGLPEMSAMVRVGSRLYVAVQRLDRDGDWGPADVSYLVVIDTSTDEIVDVDPGTAGVQGIALAAPNPGSVIAVGDLIVVGESASFGDQLGGIDVIDTRTDQSTGLVIGEEAMGGDIATVVMASARQGYAIVSDASFVNSVRPFDLSTGVVGSPLEGLSGGYLRTMAVDGDRLIVGERGSFSDPSAAGLMVYDTATQALIAGPIVTGLPPYEIAVLSDVPTAVEEVGGRSLPQQAALGAAFPNPFNAATVLPFDVVQGGARAELRVYDVLGRSVRTLADEAVPAGSYRVGWDGRDDAGKSVGNGTYVVELRLGDWRATRKVMLLK